MIAVPLKTRTLGCCQRSWFEGLPCILLSSTAVKSEASINTIFTILGFHKRCSCQIQMGRTIDQCAHPPWNYFHQSPVRKKFNQSLYLDVWEMNVSPSKPATVPRQSPGHPQTQHQWLEWAGCQQIAMEKKTNQGYQSYITPAIAYFVDNRCIQNQVPWSPEDSSCWS